MRHFSVGAGACDPFNPIALRASAGVTFAARFCSLAAVREVRWHTAERGWAVLVAPSPPPTRSPGSHCTIVPLLTPSPCPPDGRPQADLPVFVSDAGAGAVPPSPAPSRFLLVMGHETRGARDHGFEGATSVRLPV